MCLQSTVSCLELVWLTLFMQGWDSSSPSPTPFSMSSWWNYPLQIILGSNVLLHFLSFTIFLFCLTWAFLIKDLLMESWLLFPAGSHAGHPIGLIQCYVQLLNEAQMLLHILPLAWNESFKVHQGTSICLAVKWGISQDILYQQQIQG